jgi:DNA repair exonuclease SbcCD ATPase subunit
VPALGEAQAKSRGCHAVLSALEAKLEAAGKAELARQAALSELAAAEAEAGTLREAQLVLGPLGAQRRLAQGALGKIEEEANFVLSACGVPLSLKVSWEREGKDPADECPKCGRAFAATTKEKACLECGEPRGKNRIQRLDVQLSSVSGAAKALGGLSAAFGASAWLRRERDSQWGTSLLDEPLAACDKRIRQQVGTQLREMLGFAGFRQAFVVSHDAQSVSALPGRILVTGTGEGENVRSRIEVA